METVSVLQEKSFGGAGGGGGFAQKCVLVNAVQLYT